MSRGAIAVLAGLCAGVGLSGCRGQVIVQSSPAIEVELLTAGSSSETLATFPQLLDGGLSFGTVPVLNPLQKTLTVTNLGTGQLSISQIFVTPDGGAFSVVGAIPTSVGGSGSSPLTVQFDPPEQQSYSGTLQILSDDNNDPMVTIPLSGVGSTEGLLDVTPNPLNFGSVGQGQTVIMPLTLSSVGTAPLVIWSIAPGDGGDPAFAIVSSTNIPDGGLVLDAGDEIQYFDLSFSPTASTPAAATGTLVIESSDPTHQPYVVDILGGTILAPICDIVAPKTAALGETVTLDGTASKDLNTPPSLPLTYQWSLESHLLGSTAEISSTTASQVTLTPDVVGTYMVNLMVTNDAGVQSIAPGCTASIVAQPTDDLYVEMIWNNDPVDMDLHLVIDGGVFGGEGDCNAYNPDAGFSCSPGSDHLVGPGPESIAVAVPPTADYEVECKLYDAHNTTDDSTIVTVRVYVYGVLAAQVCQQLDSVGALWPAVTIAWPSGEVTPIGSSIACPETN
jgi:hypothetical protein